MTENNVNNTDTNYIKNPKKKGKGRPIKERVSLNVLANIIDK